MSPSSVIGIVPFSEKIEVQCEMSLHSLERAGIPVRRARGFSSIDFGRSVLASQALREGYDDIMWIDSDIGFDPSDVDRLRRHNLPIACALYPKKGPKEFACEFLPGTRNIVFGKSGGLHEIRYSGFGFMLVRRMVFEKIQQVFKLPLCNEGTEHESYPYFLPFIQPSETEPARYRYMPEDYAFCERARQCGFPLMADTTIRLSHIGSHAFTWDDL